MRTASAQQVVERRQKIIEAARDLVICQQRGDEDGKVDAWSRLYVNVTLLSEMVIPEDE